MRDDDEIDNTCERLIRLAVSAMETSTTSVDRLQLAALEAAVVGLDPSTRAPIVEQLDSPGRLQRISDWARLLPLIRSNPALADRYLELTIAMAREGAIEIVWRCLRPVARDRGAPLPRKDAMTPKRALRQLNQALRGLTPEKIREAREALIVLHERRKEQRPLIRTREVLHALETLRKLIDRDQSSSPKLEPRTSITEAKTEEARRWG
jgi:hypothetical protein